MRNTPYSFSKPQPTAPAPVQQTSTAAPKTESGFVDLFSRVKKTEAPIQQETQQPASTEQTTTTETTPTAQPSSSTTFEEGFNTFKDTAGKKVSDFVENPEDFAKIIVRFGNTGRCILLPNLYERAMFTQPEKDALQEILKKSYENEKKPSTAPDADFNTFEKRVYGKWKKLESAKENISYSEEEIVWLAKIVAKRIKDMTVAVWMEKYDWLLALLYLEFKHAQTILAVKAEDFITSRFMGKAA